MKRVFKNTTPLLAAAALLAFATPADAQVDLTGLNTVTGFAGDSTGAFNFNSGAVGKTAGFQTGNFGGFLNDVYGIRSNAGPTAARSVAYGWGNFIGGVDSHVHGTFTGDGSFDGVTMFSDGDPNTVREAAPFLATQSNMFYSLFNSGYSFRTSDGDPNQGLFIDGSGNVGIGTTMFGQALSVNGDGFFNGIVTANAFVGTGSVTVSGNLNIPATTNSTSGVINSGGTRILHNFGSNNFFAGPGAGNFTLTTASETTAIGDGALGSLTTGDRNTAVGWDSLPDNTTGTRNTATGARALFSNTIGTDNSAFGSTALEANISGNSNSAFGSGALDSNTTGFQNSAFGRSAMSGNTTGRDNTAVGTNALLRNLTGDRNTATGQGALFSNTSGNSNTANGSSALTSNTTGSSNTASGLNSLLSNTTGANNTATGTAALQNNLTGVNNTAIGVSAMQNNTTGSNNAASGRSALLNNTTGGDNTATGRSALTNNTTGGSNTASGTFALRDNMTGGSNTAIGHSALDVNTTGGSNASVGADSLGSNTTGNQNVAVGFRALAGNTTGFRNTAIGDGAGLNLTDGDNNINIGPVVSGSAGEGNTTRIGGGDQTRTFISGIRGVTTDVANAIAVVIDSDGQLGTVSSSRRYKEDIADMADASERLRKLRPVTFRYKDAYKDGGKPIQFGLIAEEVAEAFPELAVLNDEGKPETVKYHLLAPLLLNEVQKLEAAGDAKEDRIGELEARLAKLEKLLERAAE